MHKCPADAIIDIGSSSKPFLPMKFHLDSSAGNVFTGYGEHYVEINKQRHDSNLIAMPDRVETGWAADGFDALSREDFRHLLDWQPEIVLLGTGRTIRFPHPKLTADLSAAHVGVDVMDVPAACRTFNVLAAEGRRVLAALILD
jgi:uncharacterized protein